MNTISTTRMSSKGQIVIPEAICKQLNLLPGTQFVVVGENNVMILKAITAPAMDGFDALIQPARRQANLVGLKHSDIPKAISIARKG